MSGLRALMAESESDRAALWSAYFAVRAMSDPPDFVCSFREDLWAHLQAEDDVHEVREAETQFARQLRERREERKAWRQTPAAEREHFLLNALGDDELTIAEICGRFPLRFKSAVGDSMIRRLAKQLMERQEIDRRVDPSHGGHFHYFRCKDLEGPIKDLERTLREEGLTEPPGGEA
jgi:hypothetical protein